MKRGFTLIEVLLALTLLAVLVGLIQGAYSGAARSRALSREETLRAHSAALVFQRLCEELSMCFLSDTGKERTGFQAEVDADGNSSLSFTTRVPPIHGHSVGGESRVRYALMAAEEGEEEGSDLARQETPDLAASVEDVAVAYRLMLGVARFEVLCYDGDEWLESWQSAERSSEPYLPLAVSIEVAWAQGESERVYRTSTPVYGATRP